MTGLLFVAVSLLAVWNVEAQDTQPIVCGRIPAIYECIRAPSVVKREIAMQCDRNLPECEKITCVFRKSGWMNGDQVDSAKVAQYFEEFGRDHPEWQAAVDRLKTDCLQRELTAQGPHLNCPAFDVTHCSFATFLRNAQQSEWLRTEKCAEVRQFVNSCPICPSECFEPQIPIGSCNACNALPRQG